MTNIRGGLRAINNANAVLKNIDCDATVYVGAVVRMDSAVAYNAQADVFANSNAIGVVISKSSSTKCDIRLFGYTEDIFTGLDETKTYYLSDTVAGGIQTNVPTGSGTVILEVGKPFSPTSLVVIIGERIVRK